MRSIVRFPQLALWSIVLIGVSCADSAREIKVDGALGYGEFVYECIEIAADNACAATYRTGEYYDDYYYQDGGYSAGDSSRINLPIVAVGGRFRLRFESTDSELNGRYITLEAAENGVLRDSDSYYAESEGIAAVIAVADGTQAADFTHIYTGQLDRVDVSVDGVPLEEGEAISLKEGERFALAAQGRRGESKLAGTLTYRFATTGASGQVSPIGIQLTDSHLGLADIWGQIVGETILEIRVGGVTREVPITVAMGNVAGDTDSETGVDTASVTDGGATTDTGTEWDTGGDSETESVRESDSSSDIAEGPDGGAVDGGAVDGGVSDGGDRKGWN